MRMQNPCILVHKTIRFVFQFEIFAAHFTTYSGLNNSNSSLHYTYSRHIFKLCLISVRTWEIVYCAKTGRPSQNILVVKNVSKCNPPDFQFYPSKLTNKTYGVMLNFLCFLYCLMQWKHIKLTLYHMGKILLFNLPRQNLKSARLHFWKVFTIHVPAMSVVNTCLFSKTVKLTLILNRVNVPSIIFYYILSEVISRYGKFHHWRTIWASSRGNLSSGFSTR